jgi:hypothetical protein
MGAFCYPGERSSFNSGRLKTVWPKRQSYMLRPHLTKLGEVGPGQIPHLIKTREYRLAALWVSSKSFHTQDRGASICPGLKKEMLCAGNHSSALKIICPFYQNREYRFAAHLGSRKHFVNQDRGAPSIPGV